jgi:hypothetical protein
MGVWMLEDDFAAICLADGVKEVAIPDAWQRFATFKGSVRDFLREVKPDALHWWADTTPVSEGNPALYSVAAQGAYLREHGEEACRQMLQENGLKLGQVRKAAPKDHSKDNPYAPAKTAAEEAARQDRIVKLVKSSATLAASLARSANPPCDIAGRPMPIKK